MQIKSNPGCDIEIRRKLHMFSGVNCAQNFCGTCIIMSFSLSLSLLVCRPAYTMLAVQQR